MGSIRIVVGGFGPIYRAGLCSVLPAADQEPGVSVVGQSGELARTIALGTLLKPDVLLTDLGFPEDRERAVWLLMEASKKTRLLVLTDAVDPMAATRLLAAGVSGYLSRPADVDDVLDAVNTSMAGEVYVDPRVDQRSASPSAIIRMKLSAREREVLQKLAFGFTNAEIAASLVISVRTVETHRAHIQHKLGVRTRAELARAAWGEDLRKPQLVRESNPA